MFLKNRLSVAIPSVLIGFVLGAASVYWCFNGNTRPWRYQSGVHSVHGTSGEVTFREVVFVAPPEVTLSARHDSNGALKSTSVAETTTKGFMWKNGGDSLENDGRLDFEARGRISREQAEKLGLTWTIFSSWQLW